LPSRDTSGSEAHDGFFGGLLAGQLARDAAAVHDEDAVGEAQDFLQLAGYEHDGGAAGSQASDQLVDFGLGADVNATRGFVHQEDGSAGEEPSGEDDFLLVAAAERGRGLIEACRADAQLAGDGFGLGSFFGGANEEAAMRREDHVPDQGRAEDEAFSLAIVGDEGHAEADGVEGTADPGRAFMDPEASAVGGGGAEEGFQEVGTPGADEAGEAEDFAAADGEGDVLETSARGESFDAQGGSGEGGGAGGGNWSWAARPTMWRMRVSWGNSHTLAVTRGARRAAR
jgi:hypothetical protein